MSREASKTIFVAALGLTVSVLVLLAFIFKPQAPQSLVADRKPRQLIIDTGRAARRTLPVAPKKPELNLDPERLDSALRLEHERFLRSRPLEQHLPYRDHEIGVDIVGLARSGKPVLLVTYLHSRASAQLHFQRLLARYRDPGHIYAVRYQPVFK
ncbi:MAG TPA: hypothetical protein VIC05_12135 [Solirubrobacteraceae bacterium]|jgi:hypothetical protein